MVTEKPISDEELLEIQRRVEAAVPRQFYFKGEGNDPCYYWIDAYRDEGESFNLAQINHDSEADAQLYVHARADLANLLAEINRLKAKLEETNNLLNDEMGIV
jgi:hypothetical protein